MVSPTMINTLQLPTTEGATMKVISTWERTQDIMELSDGTPVTRSEGIGDPSGKTTTERLKLFERLPDHKC